MAGGFGAEFARFCGMNERGQKIDNRHCLNGNIYVVIAVLCNIILTLGGSLEVLED